MNQKDRDSLTTLLNQNKEKYQTLSRRIHWTEADSACLDDTPNSKEQREDIAYRILRITGSKEMVRPLLIPLLAYKAWQRTKAVYSFNREFIDAISRTDDTEIITPLLECLPFKDMLFFFPEGVLPTIDDEETAGVYVHVEKHPEHLWINFNFIDRSLKNGHQIYPGIGFALPITNGMKISQIFETEQYYNWLSTYKRTVAFDRNLNEQEAEECLRAARKVLNVAVNLMYYLSTEKPDIKPIKQHKIPQKTSAMTKDNTETTIKLHEVGTEYAEIVYRYLKAKTISNEEDDEGNSEEVTVKNGKVSKRRRPHARRAHWQQYWTGKGRTTPVVHWIPDLFVGANRDDQATIVYVERESLKGKRNPNTSKKKQKKRTHI